MIGLFRPLIPKIKSITPDLTVIEKDESRGEKISPEESESALKECTVALIEDLLQCSTRLVVALPARSAENQDQCQISHLKSHSPP